MFMLKNVLNERPGLKDCGKKRKQGLALFYVVAIQFRDINPSLQDWSRDNQISPLSPPKLKQFFTKQKIRLLLTAKMTIA